MKNQAPQNPNQVVEGVAWLSAVSIGWVGVYINLRKSSYIPFNDIVEIMPARVR